FFDFSIMRFNFSIFSFFDFLICRYFNFSIFYLLNFTIFRFFGFFNSWMFNLSLFQVSMLQIFDFTVSIFFSVVPFFNCFFRYPFVSLPIFLIFRYLKFGFSIFIFFFKFTIL
ncbi:hypothetical protein DD592_27150, partial [Enterobacter cloacae complex sp. 2DZ2F20B]